MKAFLLACKYWIAIRQNKRKVALLISTLALNPLVNGNSLYEEIVITASLSSSEASSISATIIDELSNSHRGAIHLEDTLSKAPNVTGSAGASRNRFFQIRGIGERSQFVQPINPSVGILLDGIDISGVGGATTLFDIQKTEILRGPQGTIMGANALAGMINLRSTSTDTASSEMQFGAEQYGGFRLGALLGSGEKNGWAGRLAIQRYSNDGFIDNHWLNRDDTNGRNEVTSRASAQWKHDKGIISGALYYTRIDNGYDTFSLDNTRFTLSDEPGEDDLTLKAGRINWERNLGEKLLFIQLSHAKIDTTYSYDEDWSFVGISPGWEYSSFDQYSRARDMSSIEARLRSDATDSINWVVGTFLRDQSVNLLRQYTYLPNPFGSSFDTQTAAIFGQADKNITAKIQGFIGLRLEHRGSEYEDNSSVIENFNHTYWTGRTGVSWEPNPAHRLHFSIARGARAGGVNANLLASIDALPASYSNSIQGLGIFNGESLLSAELGWKFRWIDRGLQSALTLFRMERADQQARGSLVIPRLDGSTAFIDYTDNVAEGTHVGLEWEFKWATDKPVSWYGALGLLDAEFDEYVSASGEDLGGRDQPQSPTWQYNIGAIWTLPLRLFLELELTGSDAHFFSDRHDLRSTQTHQINMSLNGSLGRLDWTIWGRNLTQETTLTRGFGTFGNDPRKQYAIEPYYQYGEPRIVGVTFDYKFQRSTR